MSEIYLSYEKSIVQCEKMKHLVGVNFISSKTKLKYEVMTVNPIAVGEIDEFRDLFSEFIQTRGANRDKMDLFESRERVDNFTVVLSAGTMLVNNSMRLEGVNLLTVALHQYVQEDGSLKYGFPVDDLVTLF